MLHNCYGDTFSLQMGWNQMVVINGLKVVWEVLVTCGEDTADRPEMPIFPHLGYGQKAKDVLADVILASYGPEWGEQRRFSVSTLPDFVLGKKSLEQWVTEEAGHLCDALTAQAGSPLNPYPLLDKAIYHVIASLIFAHRFEDGDPDFIKMLKVLKENMGENTGLFPERRHFSPWWIRWCLSTRRSWDPDQPPRDLTEAFLTEMEKAKGNPESTFNDANLHLVVHDLLGAGIVTTSATLSWALLLMILHPDVHTGHIQQEIHKVIGQVGCPDMADQARMPYTNAVIHDVQRFADIIPVTLPQRTSCDIEVQHLLIPKGTTLIPNLSSMLKDETVWEKPLSFHPEHFLDAQGHFVKHEAFMPFSAGRRACLGEPLAHMELFLFFTCLLQRFSFSVPAGQPRPRDHGIYIMPVTPEPYQLCAVVHYRGIGSMLLPSLG
ncbi:Cytochrome P450 [Apodemus speciosus]|uniref:Cytochrome P450 n=1 Tax=Apodemus speciosus TaxID=105296 RepID=A0ABQ0FK85_APOSI